MDSLFDWAITMYHAPLENMPEIPTGDHVGAFGVVRKHHIHEGVDLYCEPHSVVYAMESGIVKYVGQFTGKEVGSPWWNTTYCVMIEGETVLLNYGEVVSLVNVGEIVKAGDPIARVVPVLKKYKGKPMCMLHIERYKMFATKPIKEWTLGNQKPYTLLNPTRILLTVGESK